MGLSSVFVGMGLWAVGKGGTSAAGWVAGMVVVVAALTRVKMTPLAVAYRILWPAIKPRFRDSGGPAILL